MWNIPNTCGWAHPAIECCRLENACRGQFYVVNNINNVCQGNSFFKFICYWYTTGDRVSDTRISEYRSTLEAYNNRNRAGKHFTFWKVMVILNIEIQVSRHIYIIRCATKSPWRSLNWWRGLDLLHFFLFFCLIGQKKTFYSFT